MDNENIVKRGSTIEIYVGRDISADIMEYIFDCWVTFVTSDLGYKVIDLPMYLNGTIKE